MLRKGNGFLLPLVLVISVMVLGPALSYGQNPQVISAAYIDSTNVLQFVFNRPVFTDSSRVIRGGITLDGDNGGDYPDVTLTGGTFINPANPDTVVSIYASLEDQKKIEGMVDRNSLELVLSANTFVDANYGGNSELTTDDDLPVDFIEDRNPPTPIAVRYDAGINHLTIMFSEPVQIGGPNAAKILLPGMALDDDFGGPNMDAMLTRQNAEVMTDSTGYAFNDIVLVDIKPSLQQVIEAFTESTIILKLDPFTFLDDDHRNSNKALTVNDSINVNYLPDLDPTGIDSASYNAGENKLYIHFDEAVTNSFEGEEWVDYSKIVFDDDWGGPNPDITLSGGLSEVSGLTTLKIEVTTEDQQAIEALTNKDSFVLTLGAYAVLDAGYNGIREFTLDDSILVRYIEEGEGDKPVVDSVKYDAGLNELTLFFDKRMDRDFFVLTGITLDDDNGGPNPNVTLTGADTVIIRRSEVKIGVNINDEVGIEGMAAKDFLKLVLAPYSFIDRTNGNGNVAVSLGSNLFVSYQPDTVAPEILSVKYDFRNDELLFAFDKSVKHGDLTGISLGEITLTGGEVKETVDTTTITIGVNADDQANIEGLANSVKSNLTVSVAAQTFKNLDDVPNSDLSFQDSDTTASGDTLFVGYGRKFWDKSFEAFPTVDEWVPASLRAAGDHSYFYVADGQWRVTVTQADVDSLLTAFEVSTPADPTRGIYQICRDVFGEEGDTDGDSLITILLMDLRDEFGQGRAARYADLPKAGYFDPRNELPDTVYAHSNEVDMFYIDTDPIILEAGTAGNALADMFQRMISHHVDPDEEEWLMEGMSAMAQVITGYGFSSYQYPEKDPTPAAGNDMTSWTEWQAGYPIDLDDLYNTFLFHLYLYEQYDSVVTISAIATDTANGLASIDSNLSSLGYSQSVSQIFDDFAVACFFDTLDHPVYGNKYGFELVDLGTPITEKIKWTRDDYILEQAQWSFSNFIVIEKEKVPQTLLFNGNDETEFSFIMATMEEIRPGVYNLGSVEIGIPDTLFNELSMDLDTTSFAFLVSCSKTAGGPVPSSFVISRDLTPPEISLGVFQNPSVDEFLDIHVISSERLYEDMTDEGPVIAVTLYTTTDTTTNEMVADLNFTDPGETMFNYHAEFTLWTSGDYVVKAIGQDISGNDFVPDSTVLTAQKILANQGGAIKDVQGKASLVLPPGSVGRDVYITLQVVETEKPGALFQKGSLSPRPGERESIGPAFRFGPAGITLSIPASLTLSWEGDIPEAPLGIYRMRDTTWVYVGGVTDREKRTVVAQVTKLGQFQIQAGAPGEEGPEVPRTYYLSQNFPNPFNPITTIEYGLPEASRVTLTVYNILGQALVTLVDGHQNPGFFLVGFDATPYASGVYFYKINALAEAGERKFSQIKKMVVLK